MKRILVMIPVEEHHQEKLQTIAPDAEFIHMPDFRMAQELLDSADAVIGYLPADYYKYGACDHLRWVQLAGSTATEYVKAGVMPRETILTGASGIYGLAVAEFMLGQLLMHIRHLHRYHEAQLQKKRMDYGPVTSIWGSTTLVLGLGDIGSTFAEKMQALGSHVVGIRRNTQRKPDYVEAVYGLDQLDALLPQADFAACCLPDDRRFLGLFDGTRLQKMKKGAVLLNVAQGYMVDSFALNDALRGGHLGGACLDVVQPESLPQNHPLWTAPNLHMTPQVAGGSYMRAAYERFMEIVFTNLQAFVDGKTMINQITVKEPRVPIEDRIWLMEE